MFLFPLEGDENDEKNVYKMKKPNEPTAEEA